VAASWAKDGKEGRGQRGMKDAGEAKSSSRPATQLWVACSSALTRASAGTTRRVDDDGPEGSGGAEGGGGTEGGHNVEGSGGSTKSKMVQSEEVEATVGRTGKGLWLRYETIRSSVGPVCSSVNQ
jgi:hypothetical protein